MGQDGWLGIGWPSEYGGQNRTMIEQLIFMDEASLANAPVPFLTINTVGPTIDEAVALWRELTGHGYGEQEPLLRAAFIDYLQR